jgi:ribosomal protein S21
MQVIKQKLKLYGDYLPCFVKRKVMPKVKVRNNNVESALRVFKKKCADIVWEYRQRQEYVPKTEKRRLAKKAAIARGKRKKNDTKQF